MKNFILIGLLTTVILSLENMDFEINNPRYFSARHEFFTDTIKNKITTQTDSSNSINHNSNNLDSNKVFYEYNQYLRIEPVSQEDLILKKLKQDSLPKKH